MAASTCLYVTEATTTAKGKSYRYAYLRYDVWDEAKGRMQPKTLANLGSTDKLDGRRVESLQDFLRAWLRKDSVLPFEALAQRFEALEPKLRILCSRDFGLRFVLEQAWKELGYVEALRQLVSSPEKARKFETAIFAMVLVQLMAPRSKRGGKRWTELAVFFPETEGLELDDLYEALDVLEPGYAAVERRLADTMRAKGETPGEFAQDTTTLTCRIRYDDRERAEIEERRQASGAAQRKAVVNDPPLRLRGRSKDKRHDLPQVSVEVILGDKALIVHHATHPGNTSDKALVVPTVEALKDLGYQRVWLTADSAFNSTANRNALRAADFEFISAEGVARSKVAAAVLSHPGRYAQHPDKPEIHFKCVVAEATDERTKARKGVPAVPGPKRLYIVRHNTEEEKFALHTLEKKLERIREDLKKGGERAQALLYDKTTKRFVRRDARTKDEKGKPIGPPVLDVDAVDRARLLAGKSVIASDSLDASALGADDLYRMLADLEHVFRELKSTLEIGPVRHRRADRIRAHVMIGVMAYNLGAWLAKKSGTTIDALRDLLENLRVQEIEDGDVRYWQRTELDAAQRQLFLKLGYDVPPLRFTASLEGPRSEDLPSKCAAGATAQGTAAATVAAATNGGMG